MSFRFKKTLFFLSLSFFILVFGSGLYLSVKTKTNNLTSLELAQKKLEKISPNLIKNGNFKKENFFNKTISFLSKKQSTNIPPSSWSIYPQTAKKQINFTLLKSSPLQYLDDPILLLETKDKEIGLSQILPKNIKLPALFEINVLLIKGGIKAIVLDRDNQEISSDQTTIEENRNKWQSLSLFISENSQPQKVIIYSTSSNSDFYLSNISLKGNEDLSSYYKDNRGEYSFSEMTKDCQSISDGDLYLKCLQEKTDSKKSNFEDMTKPKLFYNQKELDFKKDNSSKNVLGAQTLHSIERVYIESSLRKSQVDFALDKIEQVWEDEDIDEDITILNATQTKFNPSTRTRCHFYMADHSGGDDFLIYLPNECCERPKNTVVLLKHGWAQASRNIVILGKDAFMREDGLLIKHEFGHFLGAKDHDDLSEIKGNFLFPQGSTKYNTDFQDIMWSHPLKANNFTKHILNQTTYIGPDLHRYYNNIVKTLNFVKPDGSLLTSGKYYLFYAHSLGNHLGAIIKNTPHQQGSFNGTISLPRFFNVGFPVGGVISIKTEDGFFYKTKFDLIDLLDAYVKNQSVYSLKLEPYQGYLLKNKLIRANITLRNNNYHHHQARIIFNCANDFSVPFSSDFFETNDQLNSLYELDTRVAYGNCLSTLEIYDQSNQLVKTVDSHQINIEDDKNFYNLTFNISSFPRLDSVTYQNINDGPLRYTRFTLRGDNFSNNSQVYLSELDRFFTPETTGRDSTQISILVRQETIADIIRQKGIESLSFTVHD